MTRAAALTLLLVLPVAATPPPNIEGVWLASAEDRVVTIAVDENGKLTTTWRDYAGHIVSKGEITQRANVYTEWTPVEEGTRRESKMWYKTQWRLRKGQLVSRDKLYFLSRPGD
jgi:hypothetical protein